MTVIFVNNLSLGTTAEKLGMEFSSIGEVISSVTEWRVGWKHGIGRVEISSSSIKSEMMAEIEKGVRIIDGNEVWIRIGKENEKDSKSESEKCLSFSLIYCSYDYSSVFLGEDEKCEEIELRRKEDEEVEKKEEGKTVGRDEKEKENEKEEESSEETMSGGEEEVHEYIVVNKNTKKKKKIYCNGKEKVKKLN
jgi:hypothetical protein